MIRLRGPLPHLRIINDGVLGDQVLLLEAVHGLSDCVLFPDLEFSVAQDEKRPDRREPVSPIILEQLDGLVPQVSFIDSRSSTTCAAPGAAAPRSFTL